MCLEESCRKMMGHRRWHCSCDPCPSQGFAFLVSFIWEEHTWEIAVLLSASSRTSSCTHCKVRRAQSQSELAPTLLSCRRDLHKLSPLLFSSFKIMQYFNRCFHIVPRISEALDFVYCFLYIQYFFFLKSLIH